MAATLAGTAIFLLLMAGLFIPLEAARPIERRAPSARVLATGVAFVVGNTLLMELAGAPLLDAIASLRGSSAPSWPRILAVVVLSDLAGTAIHLAMHRVPWLWRFHAVHHAPSHLTWIDAWRQHPVDFVAHGIAVGIPGALLGASLSDLASVVLLRKAFTTFLTPTSPFASAGSKPSSRRPRSTGSTTAPTPPTSIGTSPGPSPGSIACSGPTGRPPAWCPGSANLSHPAYPPRATAEHPHHARLVRNEAT